MIYKYIKGCTNTITFNLFPHLHTYSHADVQTQPCMNFSSQSYVFLGKSVHFFSFFKMALAVCSVVTYRQHNVQCTYSTGAKSLCEGEELELCRPCRGYQVSVLIPQSTRRK